MNEIFNPEWKRTISVAPTPAEIFTLKTDHKFVLKEARKDAMGGSKNWAILAGSYVMHGSDETGVYLRHRDRGFLRSGNFGMADRGGLFVPNDRSRQIAVWMVPRGNDVAIGLLGAAGAGLPTPDPKTTALVLAWVPPELSAEIRKEIEEANKPVDPTPGTPPRDSGGPSEG
jgi:hypothetical protein